MTCTSCALTVTKGLQKIDMEDVNANFATGEVSFSNPKKHSLEEISTAISNLGYRVVSEEQEETGLSAVEKKFYFTLIFTVPLFLHMFFPAHYLINNPWVQLGICTPVFLLGFVHFGKSAISIFKTGVPHMDVLIFIGSNAAFWYSLTGAIMYNGTHKAHNYLFFETTATIISLVLLGNVLEHRSVRQTTTAIKELSKLQKVIAKVVVSENGLEQLIEKPGGEVQIGEIVQINTGDRIPLDSKVVYGEGSVDESMVTGESLPIHKATGNEVVGGTILLSGNMRVAVVRTGSDTILSQIIELVKQAQQDKPSIQKLGDKVSAIFVPAVLAISALTFTLTYLVFDATLSTSIMNSIAVLVISCPCAMGLATPTAVAAGIGRAARQGIIIKGGSTLEELSKVRTMVFDKTGTVTTGNFSITNFKVPGELSEQEAINLIYSIELHSSHPIAKSIVNHFKAQASSIQLQSVNEVSGVGITAMHNDKSYTLGASSDRAVVELNKDGVTMAKLQLDDEIKPGTAELMQQLRLAGINTVMLSGDEQTRTETIGNELGITTSMGEQKPLDKLKRISEIAQESHTAMIGDGINDAPALAKAQVGISMGNATQVAIQASQVVILNDSNMLKVHEALLIGKHTYKTIKQNLFWAFFYNVAAIPIAAVGLLNPMIAALAMAFSDVIVIGNSIRLKRKKLN